MWLKVVFDAFACAIDRTSIGSDSNCKQDKNRHHEFADIFDTLFHTEHNNNCCNAKENGKPDNRFSGC